MTTFELFLDALALRAGYNSALVAVGAGLLGVAAGGAGAFVFLRKRALVSDAITHATCPAWRSPSSSWRCSAATADGCRG
jgi:manganese/zinc/iron transport system permease protein